MTIPLRLYPDLPAFRAETFVVSDGHRLHVAQWGRAGGIAAALLHGGPGSGQSPLLRRFFDPQRYRVVCIDQRGAGRSEPRGATAHNDTGRLIDDLEAVRQRLDLPGWLVVGGSWGATLALAYARAHPQAVRALLLRSPFLARREDIAGFFAASPLAADGVDPADTPARLAALLHLGTPAQQAETAIRWWRWERHLSGLPASEADPDGEALSALIDRYRVQSHYLAHGCWLTEPPLLARCAALPPIETLILHGRADRICPPAGAALLQQALPHARLRWLDGVGHDPTHPAMVDAMVSALDGYAAHGRFMP